MIAAAGSLKHPFAKGIGWTLIYCNIETALFYAESVEMVLDGNGVAAC